MAARVAGYLMVLLALGTLLEIPAQTSKTDSTPPAAETLRTFRFVATNAAGQPVTDLKPEEIQVTDEGKRHPLVFARLLRTAALPESKLGPREYSNRGEDRLSSSVVILLDLLNANITERGSAWNETLQALSKQEHPDNIFWFLINPDATLFAIRAWNTPQAASGEPDDGPWTNHAKAMLSQALRIVEGVKPTYLTADPGLAVLPTYQTLFTLGQQYAAMPGQKRIIWVTHGVPMTVATVQGPYDFTNELRNLGAQLSAMGVSVYTVHQLDRSTNGSNTAETLQTIAPATGGRWFENDSIGPALAAAQNDARATYLAGYSITAKEADRKFHKVRVSATRKGVKILAADGYAAVPPAELVKANADLVSRRQLDTPDIGLRASAELSGAAARFHIFVDTRDLLLESKDRPFTGQVSLSFAAIDAEGQPTSVPPVDIAIGETQEQHEAVVKDGYAITVDKNLPRGTSKVRIIVQDPATGTAGSLTLPLPASP